MKTKAERRGWARSRGLSFPAVEWKQIDALATKMGVSPMMMIREWVRARLASMPLTPENLTIEELREIKDAVSPVS